MRLDWPQSLVARSMYRNVHSFCADSSPRDAFMRDICVEIATFFFFYVSYCMFLFSLANLIPSSVIIIALYIKTRLYPTWLAPIPALSCRTMTLSFTNLACRLVRQSATLSVARFGIPLLFLYFLKPVFGFHVQAPYLPLSCASIELGSTSFLFCAQKSLQPDFVSLSTAIFFFHFHNGFWLFCAASPDGYLV